MGFGEFVRVTSDYILFIACLGILGGSLFLTIKLRFVQLRVFPLILKMIKNSFTKKEKEENTHTISSNKALLTAMSTTLGISSVVAPVIAMNLGGPGALIGFLLTAFFGSAAIYSEVNLSIQHRKKLPSGAFAGGPMPYISHIFSSSFSKFYAICCLILMSAWSGAQANQLASILNSPQLGDYRIPVFITGAAIALLVVLALIGGIKRISSLSAKLVPCMFIIYIASSLWIFMSNIDKLPSIFYTIFQSAFSPYALASGSVVGGLVSSLRWGVFKGIQACEAGVGTQSFPHSMAETKDAEKQATLAMLSTYTAGAVAFLSGCISLITNTWQDPSLPLGISMVAASFQQYFSYFGVIIVAFIAVLFGIGTSLGNSYNGSQCFAYLTNHKKTFYYTVATGVMIFLGAIAEVKTFWSLMDIILALTALPHVMALVWHSCKKPMLSAEPN